MENMTEMSRKMYSTATRPLSVEQAMQVLQETGVFRTLGDTLRSYSGYHNPKKKFRSYFLSFDGEARLEIMNKADQVDSEKNLAATGFIHLAFSVGSKEKVDELTARLKADGYEVISEPRTTGDGYYESCILDFEGNQIEITE